MKPNPYEAPKIPGEPSTAEPVARFTLVEVFIAIAAILTLVGLLFPGVP